MVSTGTRPNASERRALIDAAAIQLFAERGFATTIDDIVDLAGITKPMLYRHYESKQELCISLLERSRDELIAAPLAQFAAGAHEGRDQLAAMIDAWLGQIEAHPQAARLVFAPIAGDAEVERAQREIHLRQSATHTALLREFAPQLSEEEAEPLGDLIRAALAAGALWWLDHPDAPREVPARALLRLIDGVLGGLEVS